MLERAGREYKLTVVSGVFLDFDMMERQNIVSVFKLIQDFG